MELGLPAGANRRRVQGLRREEAALLAGISVDYYTRIEQGRTRNISDPVLDAVARALRLTDAEYSYLRDITYPVRRTAAATSQQVRPGIRMLLDSMPDVAAQVVGPGMDVLAWNRLGGRVAYDFEALPPERCNLARLYFLDEEQARAFYPDWEANAEYMVATLRGAAGRDPENEALSALIGELRERSAVFRRSWEGQHVRNICFGVKRVVNPVVGELWLHHESLPLPADPGQVLVTYAAEPGSTSAKALRVLRDRLPGHS